MHVSQIPRAHDAIGRAKPALAIAIAATLMVGILAVPFAERSAAESAEPATTSEIVRSFDESDLPGPEVLGHVTVATTVVTTTPPPTTEPAPTTTAPAPPSAPATVPAAAPQPSETDAQRIDRAYRGAVPQAWRNVIDPTFSIIPGATSWSYGDARIEIGRTHVRSNFDFLADVVAHEYAHQIAFQYGSQAFPGAAPEGWPPRGHDQAEAWADCVQTAWTGRVNPSHGLGPCSGDSLSWTIEYLAAGPT